MSKFRKGGERLYPCVPTDFTCPGYTFQFPSKIALALGGYACWFGISVESILFYQVYRSYLSEYGSSDHVSFFLITNVWIHSYPIITASTIIIPLFAMKCFWNVVFHEICYVNLKIRSTVTVMTGKYNDIILFFIQMEKYQMCIAKK